MPPLRLIFPRTWRLMTILGRSPSRNYGTDANFQNNYRLTNTFIDTWKAPFTTAERIWISEGPAYHTQVANFSALLTSQGVSHTRSIQTNHAHTWSGGWLSDAVSGLFGLEHCAVEHQLASTGRVACAEDFVRDAKILRLKSRIPRGVMGNRFGGNPYPAIRGLKRRGQFHRSGRGFGEVLRLKDLLQKLSLLKNRLRTRDRHETSLDLSKRICRYFAARAQEPV